MSKPLVHSSPIVALSSLLKRADFTLEVQELADILWLAVQLRQTSSSTKSELPERLPPQPTASPLSIFSSLPSPLARESEPQAAVYASASELPFPQGSEPFSMLPYRAPAVSALPHKLDLERALRPLMRRVFSQTAMELDEEKTAVQIAEAKLWVPALRPMLERWLDLMIVVEETASFLIWQETILELEQLMERHGAFRDVRCWRLRVDQTGTLQLLLGKQASANQRPRSYKELLDPTRRRLILIISDCVSPAWRSGKMKTLLEQWTGQNSVSVLQMLPERLWERSALGIGISAQFCSYMPGVSNSRLENNPIPLWLEVDKRTQLKLPVVTLEPEPMKHWARVVAGVGQAQTPGVLLDDYLISSQSGLLTESEQHPLTVEARVARFWATASPTARQLAGLMASTPTPISLPVVRLIQHKLLPEAGPVHLAEVLMSGLMRFDGGSSNIQTDSLPYDFIPGIRELLIDSTPISRTCNVLEQLSKFLEEKTGTALRGFTAFLSSDPGWNASIHQEIQPFAQVTRQVLHRLGGDYAKLAEQLSPVEQESASESIKLKQETDDSVSNRTAIQQRLTFKFADAEAAVNQLLEQQRNRGLSGIESDVLRGIWYGQPYQDMEKQLQWGSNSLKQTAHKLWAPLSAALQTKVRKGNFRSVMQSYLTRLSGVTPQQENVHHFEDLDGLDCNPCGFVGREAELNELTARIGSGCRLVVITGMSGTGKTWLVGKLVERLSGQFDYSFYRQVGDVPLLANWYADFLRLVNHSTNDTSQIPDSAEMLRVIMQLLREYRCLLVFDRTELVYQMHDAVYLNTNTEYGQILERIVSQGHRSCLIWIGRECPIDIPESDGRMYLCPLDGLATTEAQELLQTQGELDGTEEDREKLVEFCGGHPELLLAVANSIEYFHNGAIAEFLQSSLVFPRQLCAILDGMLEGLTEPEMALLYWLVLHSLSSQELHRLVTSTLTLSALDDAWDVLTRRGLLVRETNLGLWVLHPPILRAYVAQRLVDELAEELLQRKALKVLHRYPVLMPTAPAYRQTQQQNLVLTPLITRLKLDCDHNEATLQIKLISILEQIRETISTAPSYAAGNLLTIAGHLGVSLVGCNFSSLEIQQTDLRHIDLRDMNCADCSFSNSVFATGLSDRLVTALHPDGVLLAVGDVTGRLVLWRRVDEQLHFVGYRRFNYAVSLIEFEASGLLAVATVDNTIYLWWDQQIESIVEPRPTPTKIRSLCLSPRGEYLAAGLTDGRIMLWNLRLDTSPSVLRHHTSAVSQLTFSSNNQYLASCSDDNKVLLWDVAAQMYLREVQSSRYSDFLTLGWAANELRMGEVYQDSIRLRLTDGTVQTLPNYRGIALSLAFNFNACCLVSSSNDCAVRIWHFETNRVSILPGFTKPPVALALSTDGQILLTNTHNRVQLWDVVNQHCLWEMNALPGDQLYKGLNLQGATGIPLEARAMLADLGAVYKGTSSERM